MDSVEAVEEERIARAEKPERIVKPEKTERAEKAEVIQEGVKLLRYFTEIK
jgi:hypothetical protein